MPPLQRPRRQQEPSCVERTCFSAYCRAPEHAQVGSFENGSCPEVVSGFVVRRSLPLSTYSTSLTPAYAWQSGAGVGMSSSGPESSLLPGDVQSKSRTPPRHFSSSRGLRSALRDDASRRHARHPARGSLHFHRSQGLNVRAPRRRRGQQGSHEHELVFGHGPIPIN